MERNLENITLGEIDEGNLVLLANRELLKVVRDIADPNKVATAERQIVITLKIAPNKQRSAATVKHTVTSKMAPYPPSESDIYLGKDGLGEPIAKPHVVNQQRMPFPDEDQKPEAPAS